MHKVLSPLRLFSDPPLRGSEPVDLKFSPDGQFATYRRAGSDDRERMDLWRVDLASGHHSLWLDARDLSEENTDVTELTSEERAARERRRDFSYGITQYYWHPDGKRLLIPNNGQGLLVEIVEGAVNIQRLCPDDTRQIGFTLSPSGQQISYVRQGNLFVTNISDLDERQITSDASPTTSNGLADFLAAEEMHRFQGHWWSLDERYIAYAKVNESCVTPSFRMEVDADGARTIEQRYPYAGETNPSVELWLIDLDHQDQWKIWQSATDVDDFEADSYLARVTMAQDKLVIQTQNRLQQRLTLSAYLFDDRRWQVLYEETSDTWINLTDDLMLLDDQRMIFTTERSGVRQAILLSGAPSSPADQRMDIVELSGPSHINALVGHHDGIVYATGWQENPIENHLFALSMDGQSCRQLTTRSGVHDVTIHAQTGVFLDRFSDEHTPASLDLCDLEAGTSKQSLYSEHIGEDHPYHPYVHAHITPEFGEIAAADGQRLCYRLTPPYREENNAQASYPTIVYVYGGPGPQKSRKEWTPLTVQLFAQNGFAVLELDNRGTGNRGRAFEAPIYRNLGEVEVDDQVRCLEVLKQYPWADLTRVGMFGHSYGGYMTLMSLCQAPEHFRAGVSVAPVSDWRLYDTHYTERYMGVPGDNEDGYTESCVLSHLHQLDAPLLLMHGMADDNVLFTNSTMIMATLQSLNKPFELMTYPGAKHSMQEQDVSIHRFEMILDFFKRHLGG